MFLSSVEGGSQRGSESEKKRVHRTETDMCVVLFMSMTYSTHTHIKTVVKCSGRFLLRAFRLSHIGQTLNL